MRQNFISKNFSKISLTITSLLILIAAQSAEAQQFSRENNTILYGNTFERLFILGGGANGCQNECAKDQRCKAYSYNKNNRVCRMLSIVEDTARNGCCNSGVKALRSTAPKRQIKINNHKGIVTAVHYNPNIKNRTACVQFEPAIPATSPWACLYTNNVLHKNIEHLLLNAQNFALKCDVHFSGLSAYGHFVIDHLSCFSNARR